MGDYEQMARTMAFNKANQINSVEDDFNALERESVSMKDRDATWAERFVGRIDRHSQYKGWHALVRTAAAGFFLSLFVLSICYVVHDTGVTYLTKFDLNTDFLTEGIAPAQVASQINLGHDQTFTVAGYLLTLTTSQIAVAVGAFFLSLLSVWSFKYFSNADHYDGRESVGGFAESFVTALQWLFSTPSATNTSMWLNTEDIVVTPWIWVGFMMMFGERNIWFLVTVGSLGVARGLLFFAGDADNGYPATDDVHALEVAEPRGGLFARTWRFARNLRLSGFLGAFGITVIGWVLLWVYACKFPADKRPAYYFGSFITVFVLELLFTVVVPCIHYGIIMRWSRHDTRGEVVMALDTDRYNIIRLFIYVARFAVFFFCIRYGDTGHAYLPRWGFV